MRKNLIVVAALAALLSLVLPSLADDAADGRGYLGVSLQFTESIRQDGRAVPEAIEISFVDAFPSPARRASNWSTIPVTCCRGGPADSRFWECRA